MAAALFLPPAYRHTVNADTGFPGQGRAYFPHNMRPGRVKGQVKIIAGVAPELRPQRVGTFGRGQDDADTLIDVRNLLRNAVTPQGKLPMGCVRRRAVSGGGKQVCPASVIKSGPRRVLERDLGKQKAPPKRGLKRQCCYTGGPLVPPPVSTPLCLWPVRETPPAFTSSSGTVTPPRLTVRGPSISAVVGPPPS